MIDGKRRNLKNRKFCLKCSPFGSHNTRVDIRDKSGKKRISKNGKIYYEHKDKQTHNKYIIKYQANLRKRAIEKMGGICKRCGISDYRVMAMVIKTTTQ